MGEVSRCFSGEKLVTEVTKSHVEYEESRTPRAPITVVDKTIDKCVPETTLDKVLTDPLTALKNAAKWFAKNAAETPIPESQGGHGSNEI